MSDDKNRLIGRGNPIKFYARAAVIAAAYVAITFIFQGTSFGMVQFRISEVLTILPFFFPEAVIGLFVGCIISNFLSPNILILDVIFGSTATLISALLTYKIKNKYLAPLPPVIINMIVVPIIISLSSSVGESFWVNYFINLGTIGIGEAVVCYGIGLPLIFLIAKTPLKSIQYDKNK